MNWPSGAALDHRPSSSSPSIVGASSTFTADATRREGVFRGIGDDAGSCPAAGIALTARITRAARHTGIEKEDMGSAFIMDEVTVARDRQTTTRDGSLQMEITSCSSNRVLLRSEERRVGKECR